MRYFRTTDGFELAYTSVGEGLPFVFMPWPFSHRGLWWQTAFGRPVAEALAQRFRLIQYDSRGQGMSTRGLPEYHSMEDYVVDLETVVDQLGLERFVLYGAPLFNHVAVRYAVSHPERVSALILGDVMAGMAWLGTFGFEEIARRDWDLFIHTIASSYSLHGAPVELSYWRESVTQEDCLRMMRAAHHSDVSGLLASVRPATLVLNTRRLRPDGPVVATAREGQAIAAAIPDARLVLFDGLAAYWYSDGTEPPRAVTLIEEFLGEVLKDVRPETGTPPRLQIEGLSQRQREVLKLLAEGKTTREIAEDLVLSGRTVQRHIADIYSKLGFRNRAEATAFAHRHLAVRSL